MTYTSLATETLLGQSAGVTVYCQGQNILTYPAAAIITPSPLEEVAVRSTAFLVDRDPHAFHRE